jgi:hypothetical protein
VQANLRVESDEKDAALLVSRSTLIVFPKVSPAIYFSYATNERVAYGSASETFWLIGYSKRKNDVPRLSDQHSSVWGKVQYREIHGSAYSHWYQSLKSKPLPEYGP